MFCTKGSTLVINSSSKTLPGNQQQLLLPFFFFPFSTATGGETGQYQSHSPYLGVSCKSYPRRQVSLWVRAVFATLGTDSRNRECSWHACWRAAEHQSGNEPAAHNPHSLEEWNAFMRHLPGSETQSVTAEQSKSSWPTWHWHRDLPSRSQLTN